MNQAILQVQLIKISRAIIISNEEIEDIMKIIKSLEESELLIKGINKTIRQLELKEINKKMDFSQCY